MIDHVAFNFLDVIKIEFAHMIKNKKFFIDQLLCSIVIFALYESIFNVKISNRLELKMIVVCVHVDDNDHDFYNQIVSWL